MKRSCHIAGLLAFGLTFSAVPQSMAAAPSKGKEAEFHWAYSPVTRPTPPEGRAANAIDRFVSAKLSEEGLKGAPPADRRTLIRRIYLDLIGLPPTPAEVDTFLADKSTGAVARMVDELMSRPQYGERWARHWLDVVRYAESNGYERDGAKPHAWRYRDYVIDAFNKDKPFDRFLTEQLAGDEIASSDASTQIATTFLRLGTWDDEPADKLVDRYDQLDDILGTTSSAFLGITLRCARCHDHKFEPFSQADYYRVLSVFEPLKRPQNDREDLDYQVGSEAELAAYQAAWDKLDADFLSVWARVEALGKPELERIYDSFEKSKDGKPKIKLADLTREVVLAYLTDATKRTMIQRHLVRQHAEILLGAIQHIAPDEVKAALKPLGARIKTIVSEVPKELPRAYIMVENGPKALDTHLLKGGDPTRLGEVLGPGVPGILLARQLAPPQATGRTSGRRLWLARWMTSPDNPLVARVIVNRIWQFHFGEGLVPTSNDFGVMGEEPSNPELLDWLADEFRANGWRFKPLHRLIILSEAYQRSSASVEESAEADPKASLLWRWPQHRLEAEAIRDSILAVSGDLNPKMGGPSFYPTISRAVLEGQSKPGDGWGKSEPREQMRRSIYIFAKRSLGVPELELFDSPDTTGSCERRAVSTTGPQALTALNGEFINEQAGHFADRLIAEAGAKADARVNRAFLLALGRPPRPEETKAAIEFLEKQARQIQSEAIDDKASESAVNDANRKALQAFCLVMFNLNEFVYSN